MFCSVLFSFASVRLHSARAVYNARESVFAANHDNFIRLIFGAVFCRELASCGIKIYKKNIHFYWSKSLAINLNAVARKKTQLFKNVLKIRLCSICLDMSLVLITRFVVPVKYSATKLFLNSF